LPESLQAGFQACVPIYRPWTTWYFVVGLLHGIETKSSEIPAALRRFCQVSPAVQWVSTPSFRWRESTQRRPQSLPHCVINPATCHPVSNI